MSYWSRTLATEGATRSDLGPLPHEALQVADREARRRLCLV